MNLTAHHYSREVLNTTCGLVFPPSERLSGILTALVSWGRHPLAFGILQSSFLCFSWVFFFLTWFFFISLNFSMNATLSEFCWYFLIFYAFYFFFFCLLWVDSLPPFSSFLLPSTHICRRQGLRLAWLRCMDSPANWARMIGVSHHAQPWVPWCKDLCCWWRSFHFPGIEI